MQRDIIMSIQSQQLKCIHQAARMDGFCLVG